MFCDLWSYVSDAEPNINVIVRKRFRTVTNNQRTLRVRRLVSAAQLARLDLPQIFASLRNREQQELYGLWQGLKAAEIG